MMSSHLPAEINDQILHRIHSEYLERAQAS